MDNLHDKLISEARNHAMEARTQRGTVHDIYQALGIQKGDWNGAKPVVAHIEEILHVLAFYADPACYHAISFAGDHPCGGFAHDFSDNAEYDYQKPGKMARELFEKLGFNYEYFLHQNRLG